MIPLIPLAIVSLGGLALHSHRKRQAAKSTMHGEVTPTRQAIYDTAMNHVQDPTKLNALASTFEGEGLPLYADMLRKRANLRSLPQEAIAAREDAFKKGLSSKNSDAVYALAREFHRAGATASAAELYKHAAGLRAAQQAPVTGQQ
jgi:hypothetical protein